MFMYRMEAQHKVTLDVLIVISESDEQAFSYAEELLEQHYLVKPEGVQLSIIAKKYIKAGSGYLIHH